MYCASLREYLPNHIPTTFQTDIANSMSITVESEGFILLLDKYNDLFEILRAEANFF